MSDETIKPKAFERYQAAIQATPVSPQPTFFDVRETLTADRSVDVDDSSSVKNADELPAAAVAITDDEWTPMPLDGFPTPIRDYIVSEARAKCVDPSVVTIAMLAAAGTAIGNSRVIRLKRDWDAPAIVWGMIVGTSGEGKSLAFKAGTKFGRDHATTQAETYKADMETWRQASRDAKEADRESPAQPVRFRFDVNDVTREALVQKLLQHRRGLIRAVDEITSVFNFNEYRKGGSDEQFYLSTYDATLYAVDRIGSADRNAENEVILDRPFVSIVGGIQWGKLAKAFSAEAQDSGLAARFLLAAPPEQEWRYVDSTTSDETMNGCRRIFDGLFAMMPEQRDRYDRPAVITLTDAARDEFQRWAENEVNACQRAALTKGERTAWPKLREAAGRIALILHCMHIAHGTPGVDARLVDEKTMRDAVVMTRWFGEQTRHVYSTIAESASQTIHRKPTEIDEDVAWIEKRQGTVTTSEFIRHFGRKKSTDGPRRLDALKSSGRVTIVIGRRGGRGPETELIVIAHAGDSPPVMRIAA